MASVTQRLAKAGLIHPPAFVAGGVQYEVMMGSVAYGVSDKSSDVDIYGWCIPPKDYVFPHERGEILGFGPPGPRFDQFQKHHVTDPSANGGKGAEYDLSIYSVVKYFALCADCNPNMIDSLFVPQRCVLMCTPLAEQMRERRRDFLHKGAWHRFKGYAYSQMRKLDIKRPAGKRAEVIAEHGYDLKYAYHIVRLLSEVQQILEEGDLDLTRNREQLKAIRRGEWSLDQVKAHFEDRERALQHAYDDSALPYKPDYDKLRRLLLECLEQHYGRLDVIVSSAHSLTALRSIRRILDGAGIS